MASREDIERVLKDAKERAKNTERGTRPRSSPDPKGRVGQSMCVIGSRSGFSRRPGRPYSKPEVKAACGSDAPSLEDANAIASAARWGKVPSLPTASSRPRGALASTLMELRKGDTVEIDAKDLKRTPRTVTITGPVDAETGKLGVAYVPTSSGRVRPGHRAGGLLSLQGGTVRFQPTLQQGEVDVQALRVVTAAAAKSDAVDVPAPSQDPWMIEGPRTREALEFQLRSHDQTWGERRAKVLAWLDAWAAKYPWVARRVEAHFRGRIPTEAEAKAAAERDAIANAATTARAEAAMDRRGPAEAANSRPTAAGRGRPKGGRVVPSGPVASSASTEPAAPVRMDHVLRDLKAAAQAKGGYVERKHVAKALRVMLKARLHGLSITTPQHSFATTLDIGPGKGRSQFGGAQNDALREVFGEGAGRSSRFTVLVSRFVNDSSSVPTGIRPERIDEFRRQVAKAAGLPKPAPFSAPSRGRTNKTPSGASGDRMSDEDVQTLVTAFVRYANHHQETPGVLGVHLVGKTIQVQAEGRPVAFSVLANPGGFTVLFGTDRRLGELFLGTFALPMRGDEKASTERSRIFSWSPKAERGARWAKTMSDFSLPVVKTGERLGVGREDHDERRSRRVERLRLRAAKARGEAHSRFEASKDVPPLGEPIKIGHHSEKRHRKMLERAQSNARKSFEASKKAEHLDTRADAAETNTAISSDDPRALERLRTKLARMEAEREEVKRLNRLARHGKLSDAENPMNPLSLRDIMGERKYPLPGYAMRNQGAEIRRVRQRIEELSMREGRSARAYERGGVRVVENGELNRLQIFTDGKPPQENRTWLKGSGFRWARSEGAWQRTIGDGAWNLAMQYLDTFVEKDEDTPYARVETPPPKPTHTEADIEFWREEFALLDAEFTGKDFEAPTHAKIIEALRARKSGHPEAQASAYGEVRTGRQSLEEAVMQMYRYNRYARPKPRPKRPRKAAVSSMGRDAFVAAVKDLGGELGGQLFVSKTPTGVYFNHYNVPKDVTDGARLENNRLMLSISGWERDGSPPKGGKVKLEVMVSSTLDGLRGRTTTPEKMVDVVAQMFRRHSALESR